MLFFCLQGPLLVAEAWARRRWRHVPLHVPRPLRVAGTLAVQHARECWGNASVRGRAWGSEAPLAPLHSAAGAAAKLSICPPCCLHPFSSPHAVAQRLFFPDIVASGAPARLLQELAPRLAVCRASPGG